MIEITIPIRFDEVWKEVDQNIAPMVKEGRYLISSWGRVYSIRSNIYLRPGLSSNGYYTVAFGCIDKKRRSFTIHRLVAEAFCIKPDNLPQNPRCITVNHRDGIKTNNYFENLEFVSQSENSLHAFRIGLSHHTSLYGEDNPTAIINNQTAERIGYLLSLGKYKHQEIADMVGTTLNVVRSISQGSSWKNIYDKYNLAGLKQYYLKLSKEQWFMVADYWDKHPIENYSTYHELFAETLMNLFGITYIKEHMYTSMMNTYKGYKRPYIKEMYNF